LPKGKLPPKLVRDAIKCGPVPKVRLWRELEGDTLTRAERVMKFIETHLRVPEGAMVGQPIRLVPFQEAFIYAVYDNPHQTRKAYLSIARKNGKSALIAGLMLAHIIGPEAEQNSQIRIGAQSREQSALVFYQAEKMLNLNPALSGLYRTTPSNKSIFGLSKNVDSRAISAEAKTAHGLSPVVAILDEVGQVVGPTDPFVEAITTSQGAHATPLLIAISTSSASDADLFSIWCDDAERSGDKHTVCHVYKADEGCSLLDKKQWKKANPAMGIFRNEKDLEEQLKQAERIPSQENAARNLLLNNRISLESIWLAPAVWRANGAKPEWDVFRRNGVDIGLDLSQKNDLTVAVISAKGDDGNIHVYPFAFTPVQGIEDRSKRDRVPYDQWARDGVLTAVPGKTIDYEWVAGFLKKNLIDAGIEINRICFDRWRISEFRAACERAGLILRDQQWSEVGQGYQSMSPRLEAMETALLQERIRHGLHPILNLGAASAIATQDPAGSKKLDKTKASQKIDAIVAMLMSIYENLAEKEKPPMDISAAFG